MSSPISLDVALCVSAPMEIPQMPSILYCDMFFNVTPPEISMKILCDFLLSLLILLIHFFILSGDMLSSKKASTISTFSWVICLMLSISILYLCNDYVIKIIVLVIFP